MGNYEYEPIKKLKENNKKKMFFMFLTMFMFLGISLATLYFVYRYNDERENTIVSGLVDIDFQEKGASINLENTVPMTDEAGKKNDPYVFTVENISKIPVNLKIGIEIGENTIDLSAIRYALYINNEEVKVDNLENLDSENNFHIIEQFASGAKIEVKLVFWIDYYYEKAGGTFSGKIRVEGEQYDIIYEKEIQYGTGTDVVKDTLVSNITDTCIETGFNGGLVAINTEGTLYQEGSGQEIREYRYVGPEVDNYIYFNCQDGKEQNGDNCEIWRILGIFKDESGAEHLKIVRDNILTDDMFPEAYIVSGTTYHINYTSGDEVYWNNKTIISSDTRNNDWTTGGLQYWLNAGSDKETKLASDGYMSYLSQNAKSMIENTKYYLGNFYYGTKAISGYEKERGNVSCSESCIGGDIWEGNQATWNGNIALMYPSDYGYTANSCNWNTPLSSYYPDSIKSTSWLYQTANYSNTEWLLSPSFTYSGSIYYSGQVAIWTTGVVGFSFVSNTSEVRPSLNLISGTKIVEGDGTVDRPYQLKSGQ